MTREPFVLKGEHVSVALYIVDAPEGRFAWEIVVTEDGGDEMIDRKIVGSLSYSTLQEADKAGKEMQAKVAKGAA